MGQTRASERPCTAADYLRLEAYADTGHEYRDGTITAVAQGSPGHDRIVRNLARALRVRTSADVYGREVCVRVSPTTYCRPDVSVVDDPTFGADYGNPPLVNPLLLAEVFSPRSELADRTWRFEGYRATRCLGEFLLVAENQPRVEQYFLSNGTGYIAEWVRGIGGVVHLRTLNVDLPLSEVYDGITFVPLPEPSWLFTLGDEDD